MEVNKQITLSQDNVAYTVHIDSIKYDSLGTKAIYAIAVYNTGSLIFNTDFDGNIYPREIILTISPRATIKTAEHHWIASKVLKCK